MLLWSGDILIEDGNPDNRLQGHPHHTYLCHWGFFANTVTDILLHNTNASSCPLFDSASTLRFLSFIEVAKVPLHVFIGPVLSVYTSTEATETWLNEYLVKNAYGYVSPAEDVTREDACWWMRGDRQSELGILLKVDEEKLVSSTRPRATEILLYAVLPGVSEKDQNSPLTPPRSSSPSYFDIPLDSGIQTTRSARLCARLLSSDLHITPGQHHVGSKLSSDEEAAYSAQFLTPPPDDYQSLPPLPKRQRLDSLFDNAARQSKQSRKRGGENLAKAIAHSDMASARWKEGKSIEEQIHEKGHETHGSSAVKIQSRPTRALSLARSQSLGSLKDLDAMRPSSRLGSAVPNKRPSLHRVTSIATHDSSSPTPESMTSTEHQNKTALTKVVMAGLRLYGFQPKKKSIQPKAELEDTSRQGFVSGIDHAHSDEEEYKLLYHQTFKSASFVFRNRLASQIISQDLMREAVDRLLAMFCNDPLQKTRLDGGGHRSFGNELSSAQQVFDSPSDGNAVDRAQECFGTPRKAARP